MFLPKIDVFMMSSYFSSNPDFTSAELRGVKASRSERESYGGSAIGYVHVKRENDVCIVKARITPEHNVRQKCYNVTATCNETEGHIKCEDYYCAAHLGGFKHAVAFLAWLHRRSEDPPSTSVECYWKKAKLSTVGTSLKYIKAKEITSSSSQKKNIEPRSQSGNFLSIVKSYSHSVNGMDSQIMKYFNEPTKIEKLSIHYLRSKMPNKPANAQESLEFCYQNMDISSCKEAATATVHQSECPIWYARITASKAHEAAQCKTLQGALSETTMGATKLKDTEAMKRGRLLESQVLKRVEPKNIKIKRCGLMLNSQYPVKGASPDGVTEEYIIEVKCPSTEKATIRYIKNDQICIKYKAQVQLQMHSYNKCKALFCVAAPDFETSQNINLLEVQYEKEFCEDILKKCTLFWCNAIFPFLNK